MSSKAEQRKQKKRASQKKKRARASVRRSRQTARLAPQSLAASTSWPIGECYVSDHWYEDGAHVHAYFTRRSSDGALAAASFEVDLTTRGLLSARPLSGLTDGQLQTALVQIADDHAMVTQDAALVVRIVEAGVRLAREGGHPLPRELESATAIFGDVSAADCPHEIRTGPPLPPPPPRTPGLITRALDKLFGG